MMKRRHQIVHRADRTTANGLTEINAATVWDWTQAAIKFTAQVSVQVHAKHAIVSAMGVFSDIAKARGIDPAKCGLD